MHAAFLLALASAPLFAFNAQANAQFVRIDPVHTPDPREHLSDSLHKLSGTEPKQNIQYARIFLDGRLVPPNSPADTSETLPNLHDRPPVLIAQCTRNAAGKLRFELFMNFGIVGDYTFHPPWKSSGPDDVFPPRTAKTSMTFDFFGYIHPKPVRRQWELQVDPIGEMRYNPPSGGSANMEEIAFYMQYLRALPTLRITESTYAAQFETAPWLKVIHDEPLCRAAGV